MTAYYTNCAFQILGEFYIEFLFNLGEKVPGFAKYSIPMPGPETAVTADVPAVPKCSISPQSGTVLDPFEITCESTSFCSGGCLYCFKTSTGNCLIASQYIILQYINNKYVA